PRAPPAARPPHPTSPTRRSSDLFLRKHRQRDDGGRQEHPHQLLHREHSNFDVTGGASARGVPACQGVVRSSFFVVRSSLFVLRLDRKSTRLNSSHLGISYAVFCS